MKLEMGNEKCVMRKAGVSLITVLLFMLIATIAATATYKWITSEGHSSASRMMEREAYQSSIAGLENARAWMTFHANETGALIRQYIYNTSTNQTKAARTPINLDDRMNSFSQGNRQNNHVWLVGVNTTPPTFKVKILSEGLSRDGRARHTEVAIFNVDGLYQVNKPEKYEETSTEIDFKYNYFGASTTAGGNLSAHSLLINGNLDGANPVYSETDLVVTGNLIMSGSGVGAEGTTCVGGNFDGNNGVYGKDFYIGGNAVNFKWPTCPEGKASYNNPAVNQVKCGDDGNTAVEKVTGNVYINGNLGKKGVNSVSQNFPKNLTLNGTWVTNMSEADASVAEDLCLGAGGLVLINTTESRTFHVDGNVWMPGNENLWLGSTEPYGCVCKVYSLNSWPYSLIKEDEPCTKSYEDWNTRRKYEITSCAGTQLVGTSDNRSSYEKIVLGSKTSSKVYIKNGYPSSDYTSKLATKKGEEKSYHKIQCKSGDCNDWGEYTTWGSNKTHYPYPGITTESDLYYWYYMPDGKFDVGYGKYTDTFWGKELYSYFLGYSTQDKYTRITDSYHTKNEEENRTIYVSRATDLPDPTQDNKYYHYLNHDEKNILGSPYCKLASSDDWRPTCGVFPWFKSVGETFKNKADWPTTQPFKCAESVKDVCMQKFGNQEKQGCDGAKYKVDDLLEAAYSSFETYANKGCNVTSWSNDVSDKLNTCYSNNTATTELIKTNLYNGYQVVKISSTPKKDPFTPLEGNFIIIVTTTGSEDLALPPTTASSNVFVYFTNGYTKNIQPACSANDRKDGKCTGDIYNYFIYTKGDIGKKNESGVLFNSDVISGSIYAEVGEKTCAKVGKFQGRKMEYNDALIKSLEKAGILCAKKEGETCGTSTGTGSTSPSSSTYSAGKKDPYYISMAPQLGVTLESQYESTEPVPTMSEGSELDMSFIVLPRIIYLTKDPSGKLSDYYNVIPLNGSNLSKEDVTINCPTGLKTNDNLGTLVEDLYECTASHEGYSSVPFWVWVKGSQSSSPAINFVEQSKNISPGGSHDVRINVPPHSSAIDVTVSVSDLPTGWTLTDSTGHALEGGTTYTFSFGSELVNHGSPNLFIVHAPSDATNGSVNFTLQPGENYRLGNPWSSTVLIASTATLSNTGVVSLNEINTWCADGDNASLCPNANLRDDWPDCLYKSSKLWVEPDWEPGANQDIPNAVWKIVTSNEGTLKLKEITGSGCVVIIPKTSDNSIEAPIEADQSYYLNAIAKAVPQKLTIRFIGEIEATPAISITAGERGFSCTYGSSSPSCTCTYDGTYPTCEVSVFEGEGVKIKIDKNASNNAGFSYWKCDNNGGSSCPTQKPITSGPFGYDEDDVSDPGFYLSDNNAIIEAHFGEQDKHCFFDEFKDGEYPARSSRASIKCLEGSTDYCIETCSGTCTSASTEDNVKWHLMRGSINDIAYSQGYGHISAKSSVNKGTKDSDRNGIVVLSTVNAGVNGTMKALIQLPKASLQGADSKAIRNSGFILHSNPSATQYLMLNLYANEYNNLEAQLCKYEGGNYTNCSHHELLKNSTKASVDVSSMVMVSAKFVGTNLIVSAFKGNYYGNQPEEYKYTFNVSSFDYNDREHEFVGFALADQNFKIHGIGWKSDDYDSECFDTYPTVTCSFAAVAKGGIIETGKSVKPWVGHSGWFDRSDWSCTEEFYYYNGEDAGCGNAGNEGVLCSSGDYTFDNTGAGAHGYRDNDKDQKTAKAWLNCSYSVPDEKAWMTVTEAEKAHCGYFWTGEYQKCANDAAGLVSNQVVDPGYARTFNLDEEVNLRQAKLTVNIVNNDANEVEIWLYSKNGDNESYWGEGNDFESQSVRITSTRTFDVANTFVGDSSGFNPEHVNAIKIKNHGKSNNAGTSVTIESIDAACENAIKIHSCKAVYDDEQKWWKISVEASNKDNIEKVIYSAKVGNENQFNSPVTKNCENGGCIWSPVDGDKYKTTFYQVDNPYESNQGKTYVFEAKIEGNSGRSKPDYIDCAEVDPIGEISVGCELLNVTAAVNDGDLPTKEQGDGLPSFRVSFSGCPNGGCSYKVYLDGNEITSSGKTYSPAGNTESAAPYAYTVDSEHTFTIESTSSDYPFESCTRKFKITEKVADPIDVSCNIAIENAEVSQTTTIPADQVTVTNCGPGECKYIIKEGDVNKSTLTDYVSNANLTFNGATEAGQHNYTLFVTRTEDNSTANCPFSAHYRLNVNCDNIPENQGSDTPLSPTQTVSVEPVVSGCGTNCTYQINAGTGGNPNPSGGDYSGGSVSFTDENAEGPISYDLVITHGTGNTAQSGHCPFMVTYETASTPPSSGCHCADYCGSGCESNITTGNVYHNNDNWSGCVFLTSATRINIDNTGYTGYTINNNTIYSTETFCYDNPTACATKLASYGPDPDDGGWYIKIGKVYTDIQSSGYNPCATVTNPTITACPVASAAVPPSGTVKITPTTTNCYVLGGCDYTILPGGTGDKSGKYYSGSITFTGESTPGTVNYTISISNSAGPAPVKCSFQVTYNANSYVDASVGIQYSGPKKIQYSIGNTCQIDASSSSWNTWVDAGTISGYWGGNNGQMQGNIKISIPSGEWFKISNCW